LPYLISRLVRATTPASTIADFPAGSASYIGGWDGVVTCHQDTAYVPKGISLYEFGTEANPKGKADDDYDKRKLDSLGYNPKESVFVFVTPRFWKFKDKWIKAKKAEEFWKDVIVYDSSNLEQWLDIASATSRWFSAQPGVESYPFDGIMAADEFWEEWSTGPNNLVLKPEVVTVGREYQQEKLLAILQGIATVTGIKASSKSEAIAFIIAAAKQFPKNESERFFSKSLVVDTEGNFRGIRINTTTSLNLISRFDETQPLHLAATKGHHVLVPLGAEDSINSEPITLPTIDRNGQVNALVNSGISKEHAERFSKEAGRNITILKKLLGFSHSKAKWFEKEDIREIIPALLLGRWNEMYIGDIELLEKLSGKKYSDYLPTLTKWKNYEESPLLQIGETWRLTSPLDLWTSVSPLLTPTDFHSIQDCFSFAFKSGNPIVEPKDENDFAAIFNKQRKFSNWSREGLTQSLILVGRFGAGMNIPNLPNPQLWVDDLIYGLLNDASSEIWISVDHELPVISEASPTSFLKATSNSLSKEQPEIMDLFKEVDGVLLPKSHHTGLLWALEGLAWLPEYLREASSILLKLSTLDPGGSLSNRPINSLIEIFKTWNYQTLATYNERMEILKDITNKAREAGWTLLINLLPGHREIGRPTHQMRWRMFDKNTNITYTYEEIWRTNSVVIELLLNIFDNDENKFSQLISKAVRLSYAGRKRVLEWANVICDKVEQTEFTTWEAIRNILSHHRSNPDADWSLPESELKWLEDLYDKTRPNEVISQHIWLFNDSWPAFPEGFRESDIEIEKRNEQQQRKIDIARSDAVQTFLSKLGFEKTLELRMSIKQPWVLGDVLARVVTNEDDVVSLCECLNDDKEYLRFIYSFVFRKSTIEGFAWVTSLLKSLQLKRFSNNALANILIPLSQSKELWDFVSSLPEEIQKEYWQNVDPTFYNIPIDEKILGVQTLMNHKRFLSAIDICSRFAETMPTSLLTVLLKKTVVEERSEGVQFKGYEIERIFKTLDKRDDLEKSIRINLEWLYLPLLHSYGSRRNPKTLELELADSPEFFIDILKWVYKPQDKRLLDEERKGISEEIVHNRAKQAYYLLHSWKKIPGMKGDRTIDDSVLKEWIEKVRKLAKEASRLDAADKQIGQILAQYPESTPLWPQEIIFQIIEEINTESLKRNYSAAMFNKRASSSRGPFDGGNIERGKAEYFEKLARESQNNYPNVAEIFRHLAEGYLMDAKRMDDLAERDKLEY
jgi:hypothetical protein